MALEQCKTNINVWSYLSFTIFFISTGPDNPSIPTLGPQTYFHPNSPNTYQHNPHLQHPMTHSPPIRPQAPYIPTQGMHLMLQPPFPPSSLTRPPSRQIRGGSVANGNRLPHFSSLPHAAGEISVNMPQPPPAPSAGTSLVYSGCHPCVQVPHGDRPQMLPYTLQVGHSFSNTYFVPWHLSFILFLALYLIKYTAQPCYNKTIII